MTLFCEKPEKFPEHICGEIGTRVIEAISGRVRPHAVGQFEWLVSQTQKGAGADLDMRIKCLVAVSHIGMGRPDMFAERAYNTLLDLALRDPESTIQNWARLGCETMKSEPVLAAYHSKFMAFDRQSLRTVLGRCALYPNQ